MQTGTQEVSSELQGELVLTQKFSPQKCYSTHYKSTYKLIIVNKHNLHAGDFVLSQMHSILDNTDAQYFHPFIRSTGKEKTKPIIKPKLQGCSSVAQL